MYNIEDIEDIINIKHDIIENFINNTNVKLCENIGKIVTIPLEKKAYFGKYK